eukprot:GHVU01074598.1.p1 GENE.GHVU01074598.1~~GHVU01074598.1.p1  ORF type:complete len:124 (+),score=18.42 GHVU01074598.1:205-576(+)
MATATRRGRRRRTKAKPTHSTEASASAVAAAAAAPPASHSKNCRGAPTHDALPAPARCPRRCCNEEYDEHVKAKEPQQEPQAALHSLNSTLPLRVFTYIYISMSTGIYVRTYLRVQKSTAYAL